MANIGALVVNVDANTAGFTRNMDKAAANVKSNSARMNRALGVMQRGLDRVRRAGLSMAKSMFSLRGAIGLLAGSAGIGLIIKKSIDAADAIAKTADKIGVSTDTLQEYRFAAEQSGVNTRTFDLALQRLSRRFGEAAAGGGELSGTLKQYNIATHDADGQTRSVAAVMDDMARAIQGADSDSERLRIAFKAFDSEGAALVNMLRQGPAALQAFQAQARDLGLVISEDLLRAAEGAKDKLNILGKVISTNVTVAVLENVDAIGDLAQAFTDALPEIFAVTAEILAFLGIIERTNAMSLRNVVNEIDDTKESIVNLQAGVSSFLLEVARMTVNEDELFSTFGKTPLEFMEAKLAELEARRKVLDAAIGKARPAKGGIAPDGEGGIVHGKSDSQLAAEARADSVLAISKALAVESEALAHNQAVYGQSVAATARLNAERSLALSLQQQGIVLTERERSAIDITIGSIVAQTEAIAERDRIQAENMKRDEERRTAAAEKLQAKAAATAQMFDDSLGSTIATITNQFTLMANEGEFNFSRLGDSIRETMRRIVADISAAIIKAEILAAIGTSGGGGGGGFGGLFSAIGGLFSGGGGGSFAGAGGTLQIMKRGGIVGGGGARTNRFNPLAFAGAQHYADGGAVPIIAHKGERVLTQAQNQEFEAGGAGGGVVVNQSFSFSGDVTQATRMEVLRLMPDIRRATVAGVVDAQGQNRGLLRRF